MRAHLLTAGPKLATATVGVVRFLEVRRHSLTKKGPAREIGSLLSREGVARARIGRSAPTGRLRADRT